MSKHPLCCDCDGCLNRGGGVRPDYAPIKHTTLGRPTAALKNARRGAALIGGRGAVQLEPLALLRDAYLSVLRRWRERTAA